MGQGFKLIAVAAVGVVAALAVPARAQTLLPGGLYIGAQGGWTSLETVTNDGHPQRIGPFAGQNAQSIESFDSGFNVDLQTSMDLTTKAHVAIDIGRGYS